MKTTLRSLAFAIIIFVFSSLVLNAQQVSCTFAQPPNTALYNCGSMVTASVVLNNLPAGVTYIEVYYPLQFDLSQIGSVIADENSYIEGNLYQTIGVTDPTILDPTVVNVTLKRIRIPIDNFTTQNQGTTLMFIVNNCDPFYNGIENTTAFPMFFDLSAGGPSIATPVQATFNQQLQQFGSSGIIKFTNYNNNIPVLSTQELNPSLQNFITPFTRDFKLQFYGNTFENITITISQETDVLNNGLFLSSFPTVFSAQQLSGNGGIYTINANVLANNGINLSPGLNTLYFRQACQLQCDSDVPVTSILASILCSGCTIPLQSNTISLNATYPLTQSYTASHNLEDNGGCFNNLDYQLSLAFSAQNFGLGIDFIEFPFSDEDLSINSISISAPGQTALQIPITAGGPVSISNNRLRITLSNIDGSSIWPGLEYDPSISTFVIPLNPPTPLAFTINVNFGYNCNNINDCDEQFFRGISQPVQNKVIISFLSGCLNEAIVHNIRDFNLPSSISFPNQNYVLAGGCVQADLDETVNPNLLLNFDYNFYTSGNLNPLALYSYTNSSVPQKLSGCSSNDLTYQFVFSNQLSLSNGNILDYIDASVQIATLFNGISTYNGSVNGNTIIVNIPASEISTSNNLKFVLDLNNCPFTISPYNGIATFQASVSVFCNNCSSCYRKLTCNGLDNSDNILLHCSGPCTAPSGGAGTLAFAAKRTSFGWNSQASYQANQINPNVNLPFLNEAQLSSQIALLNPGDPNNLAILNEELSKVYPYDLILVHAEGDYTNTSSVTGINFEIVHNPYLGPLGTESFLELVPNSAFVDFDFPDLGISDQRFFFNNTVDFQANSLLTYNNISIPVNSIKFSLDNTNLLNTLNSIQGWNTQTAQLDFYAIFKIIPAEVSLSNPINTGNTVDQVTLRGQFLTSLTDNSVQASCDSWGAQLNVLIPGVARFLEEENVLNGLADLPIDAVDPSVTTFDFSTSGSNTRSYCNQNLAFGIHLFGGYGPTHIDFPYEFRPFIRWPQTSNLNIQSSIPNDFQVFPLYNATVSGFPQSILSGNSSFNSLIEPTMKGGNNNTNRYSGFAFSITKDSPNKLKCELNTDAQVAVSLNIPRSDFAYTHSYFSNVDYPNSSISPYSDSEVLSINSSLNQASSSLNIYNNAFENEYSGLADLNMYDICDRLKGSVPSTDVTGVNVSDQFSFTFNFGTNTQLNPLIPETRVWALCRFVTPTNQVISIPNWGFNITSSLNAFNPQLITNSDLSQQMLYFPDGINAQTQIQLISSQPICLPEGTRLEIIYGMFCEDFNANDHATFFNSPEDFACFSCKRTVLIFQEVGISYQSNSNDLYMDEDNCRLVWNVNLKNSLDHVTILNPTLRFVLPEGLLISYIDPNSNTINNSFTDNNGDLQVTYPIFTTNYFGGTVTGGAAGDVSSIVSIDFADDFSWKPGSELSFQLTFAFASELCEAIENKGGTALDLIAFGQSICGSTIDNIPITSQGNTNFPPFISDIENLQQTLTNPESTCCLDIDIDISLFPSCPGFDNGILQLNNITINNQNVSQSIVSDAVVQLYHVSPNGSTSPILPEMTLASDLQDILLSPGIYTLSVFFPFEDLLLNYYSPFEIVEDLNTCACDCDDASLPVLQIPPSITNSEALTQYLIEHNLYFPDDDNNEYGVPYISNHCIKMNNNLNIINEFILDNCELKIAMGRKIVIGEDMPNTAALAALQTRFSGCEYMWKGIDNKGQFISFNSVIEDAQYGILLDRTNGVITYLRDTDLKNNFVGIKTQEIQGQHGLNMKNVHFVGGPLKLPYPNQLPVQLETSLAGIVLNEDYELHIDQSIQFEKLCNGVIVNNSLLSAKASKFIEIQPSSQYIGSEYWLSAQSGTNASGINVGNGNGSGIFGLNATIRYTGLGDNPVLFDKCLNGVFVNNSHLDLQSTRMRNVRQGVLSINSTVDKQISILHNMIEFKTFGVRIIDANGAVESLNIELNRLIATPNGKNIGIASYGSKMVGIVDNVISNSRIGIGLTTSSVAVTGNTVSIPNLAYGINMQGSSSSDFKCNSLNGSILSNNPNQIGFKVQASPYCTFVNNSFDNTYTGFQVSGPSTAGSFEINRFGNHRIGFDVTPTGILGEFTSAGNRWMATSYAIAGARNQTMNGDPTNPTLTRFIVEPNPTQELWPSQWPLPSQECAGNFFPCLSTLPTLSLESCITSTTPGGNVGIAGIPAASVTDNFYKLASKVANDSLQFDTFNEELLFSVRRQIKQRLSSQELTLPDTGSYATLKYALEHGTEKKFNTVDAIMKPQEPDLTVNASIKTDLSALHALTYAIFQLDSLTQEPNANLEQLKLERAQLVEQLELLQLQLKLLEEGALLNQGFKTDSAFYYNNGIVTQEEFEQYEKQINTIYLETYAKGNYVFTYEQAATIHQIATMCPSLGGSAVFKARTLNALLNDTLEYNDDLTCLQQGVLYRLAQSSQNEEKAAIQVYPNPSSNQLTIIFDNTETFPLRIEIMDALGRITSSTLLHASPAVLSAEISNLASGLYFYRITDTANTLVKQDKLVKQ